MGNPRRSLWGNPALSNDGASQKPSQTLRSWGDGHPSCSQRLFTASCARHHPASEQQNSPLCLREKWQAYFSDLFNQIIAGGWGWGWIFKKAGQAPVRINYFCEMRTPWEAGFLYMPVRLSLECTQYEQSLHRRKTFPSIRYSQSYRHPKQRRRIPGPARRKLHDLGVWPSCRASHARAIP